MKTPKRNSPRELAHRQKMFNKLHGRGASKLRLQRAARAAYRLAEHDGGTPS